MTQAETTIANQPQVTLVVGPRERFSYTRESLESIYQNTDYPFDLVFVDVCSPKPIRNYVIKKSQEKSFKIIHTNRYISPNQARNVGLRYVLSETNSPYVVFIENDVIVKKDWLKKLVQCAEATNAAVVGPLTCIGHPAHQVIHNAGGKSYIQVETKHGQPRRRIRQSAYLTGTAIAEVPDQLQRTQCDYVEFHCMLARTAIFEHTGLLDEGMMATREHIDFCFMVQEAGGTIYNEREAVVTTDTLGIDSNKAGLMAWFGTLELPDFKLYDLPYFMLRWSDAWDIASLHHLRDKWGLTDQDKYFKRRYAGLGSRRHELLIKPLVNRLTFGKGNEPIETFLISLERRLNRYLYHRYTRRHPNIHHPPQPTHLTQQTTS